MGWPFTQREAGLTATQLVADRTGARTRSRRVTRRQSLSHSAVWACLRLRADLISTMPVDVFRRINGIQVEQAKPPVLITPGGKKIAWLEWMYSTQIDLDSVGNTVGVITARDGLGIPAVIELQNIDDVTFLGKGNKLTSVKIGTTTYNDPDTEIWHEKQYTLAGVPIGLSPIAHAAMSIQGYLSAQQFAEDWFSNSTMPGGHLKNTARKLVQTEAIRVKNDFKSTVEAGDVWVSGNDWSYEMLSAKASESNFLETMKFSIADVCRFLGVPADMIDAESSSGSITYANVTQRNMQLLIMNLNPAILRREDAISRGLLPQPRYVKFNRGALLQMDLKSRYEAYGMAIEKRFKAPSEIRDDENLPPFTPEQEEEFARLFGSKAAPPVAAPVAKEAPELRAAETHLHLSLPEAQPITIENRVQVPEQPAPVVTVENRVEPAAPGEPPVVNLTVEPTPVTVENRVSVPEQQPTPVTVEVTNQVEPTPVTVENQVDVAVSPADVVLNGPKATSIKRDAKGEITGTTYEYEE